MTEATTRSTPYKLKLFYSYRIDFFFILLLLILSILYFRDILGNDTFLLYDEVAHGDLRYALSVDEHFRHHLSNLPIHAAKLPLLSILYPLKIILGDNAAEKVFTILTLFLAATFVYLANKQVVGRFEGKRRYWLSASCFVGSLVIMYNPWTLDEIHHHYWLVLSLAASYLLIAFIDSYIHSKERRNILWLILIGFSTSLMATQPHGPIIYFLPMLAIYLVVNLTFHRPIVLSNRTAKKISILLIIIIACNVFWLVPVIQTLTMDRDRISHGLGYLSSEESEGFVTYGIVHENVDQLSRRATIQNVFKGTSDWIWASGDNNPNPSIKVNNIDLWEGLAFLPLSFTFLFFFIRSPIGKDMIYIVVFFIALAILSVVLGTGSYYNDSYKRFFLNFPFGEAIRDPYKFAGLYFAAVSFFVSASIYRLDRKSLRKNMMIILLMLALILSWGWVGLTGNLNGHITRALPPYPHDLSDVSEYLHREYAINSSDAKGRIFWYPADAADNIQLQYSSVPELSTESLHNLKPPPYQLNYINDLIEKNDTSFISLLEYLGVQYLVIREDYEGNIDDVGSPESLQELQRRVENLKIILHDNKVFESGRFGVYKLNTNSPVTVSHAVSAGTDDLSKVARVAEQGEYLNNIQLGPFLDDDSLIVTSDLLPPGSSGEAITVVDPTSEHHMPGRYWSTGAINGGWLSTIIPHLNNLGIKTWQFDYNMGFIFTWSEENSISVPFKMEGGSNNDDYKLFIRYLESPKGGLINARLDDNSSLIQISTMSPSSKFVWVDLGEYTLNQGTHTMTFTNERGFNAINSIMLIKKDQFEVLKGQIQDWVNRNSTTAIYIFDGESDMNGNMMNAAVWKQFDVKKEDDYKIWIKGSGMFSVLINDQTEIVNATMNRPDAFSGSFQLKEGDSRLEITPLQGLADNTGTSKDSEDMNVLDSIWLVSDSNNRLHKLLDDDNNDNRYVSMNQVQEITTTPISTNVWSSQKYEIKLNNVTTKSLMISLANPFDSNLKAKIYTRDGLSKTENLIPLFYSLKSGVYIDSLATDAKVVIYDASAPLQWFAVATFISLASYVLLILSANLKLTNRFKGLVLNLGRLMKERIS